LQLWLKEFSLETKIIQLCFLDGALEEITNRKT